MSDVLELGTVQAGIPDSDYHGDKRFVSSSILKRAFETDWESARYSETHPSEDKPYFMVGRAVHSLVLGEGEMPELKLDGRTKAGKEQAERTAGSSTPLLTKAQMEQVEGMAAAVAADKTSQSVLLGGMPEQSITWQDEETGVWCKCRPDSLGDLFCVDVKTCQDPSPRAFAKDAANLGYALQAAFYLRGILAVTGGWPTFVFLAVGKNAPYRAQCYVLPEKYLEAADRQVGQLLGEYAEHLESGKWPGLPGGIQAVEFPGWAEHQLGLN